MARSRGVVAVLVFFGVAANVASQGADWKEDAVRSREVLLAVERAVCANATPSDDRSEALLLLGIAVLLPLAFMLSVEKSTAMTAWPMLEQFMAIFLAASWFAGVNEFVPSTTPSTAMHLVLAYNSMLVALWLLRGQPRLAGALCAIASHYVSFAAMKTSATLQEEFFSESVGAASLCSVLVIVVAVAVFYAKDALGSRLLGGDAAAEEAEALDEWTELTDDLGWDVAGMSLALTSMQTINMFVFGTLGSLEEGTGFVEDVSQGTFSLVAAMCFTCVDAAASTLLRPVLHPSSGECKLNIVQRSLAHVLHNTITMCAAWGYLSMSKFAVLYRSDPGQSRSTVTMLTALFCSAKSIVVIIVLSIVLRYLDEKEYQGIAAFAKRLLRATALVSAWAWEAAFDAAFDKGLVEEVYQLGMVFLLSLVLVPIYVLYLRPTSERHKSPSVKQD